MVGRLTSSAPQGNLCWYILQGYSRNTFPIVSRKKLRREEECLVEDGALCMRPNYASELFVSFVRKHGLPPLTLHGLRHSFASIANAKGIPMYDIGKALGHSSPSTTSKVYTHLLDRDHKDLLERMWEPEKPD